MKQEIINRFTELLSNEFTPDLDKEFKELGKKFNDERRKQREEQLVAFLENGENKREDFTPEVDPIDDQFDALYKQYRDIKIKKQEERAAEERQNLSKKKAILKQIAEITDNEEHIGKAFDQFKELQSQWNAIGRVPGDVHQDILSEYHQSVEKFYYDIKIYQELREFDLKKNLEAKTALLNQIKAIDLNGDMRAVEAEVKKLQNEWFEIGPVARELYEDLKTEFSTAMDAVYAKLKSFYEDQKKERTANLEAKSALLANLKEIVAEKAENHKEWMSLTDKVKDIQNKWKSIGPGPRKENEELWQSLRTICDDFFEKKQAFYEVEKGKQDKNKTRKEELIQRAEALKESTDWKESTQKLIKIQGEWKRVGPARQKDEQELWKTFRSACNYFFDAKKAHFDKMDEVYSENLKGKEALLKEIEAYKPDGEKDAVIEQLKAFTKKWNSLGKIPRKDMDRIQGGYQSALDAHYSALGISAEELENSKFMSRLESFEGAENKDELVANERRFIREKVDGLTTTLNQYETNLSFFGHNTGSDLYKEAEQKVKQVQRQLENWKQKLKLLKTKVS